MKKIMNAQRETVGERIFNIINIILLTLFSVSIIFPILNVISVSFSSDKYIYTNAVSFYPKGFTIHAYETVMSNNSLLNAYGNTIKVILISVVFSLILTAFAAYPLAFGSFYGKKIYKYMILVTLWFNSGIVPTFMVINRLGMVNTHWPLILVPLISAYNVVIVKSFYEGIPQALIESATLDGANDLIILFRIVLPLSKAVLATVGLWIVVDRMNDFLNAVVYLRDYEKYTVQVVLRDIVIASSAAQYNLLPDESNGTLPEQIRNASIVVTMLPIIMVYPFLQKYFVKGVTLGAVKG